MTREGIDQRFEELEKTGIGPISFEGLEALLNGPRYIRKPEHDKRFAWGDDYAGSIIQLYLLCPQTRPQIERYLIHLSKTMKGAAPR